jgi:hypothetical protein
MAQKSITVNVQDSAYDLMEGLKAIAVAIKAAKAMGVAAEAEAGVMAALAAFSTKMGELQNLKADFVADHAGFYAGLMNGALDLALTALG